jgi:entericidin B
LRVRYPMFHERGPTMKRMISLLLAASFALSLPMALGGCNTIQGAGKDVERGGEKIQKEAQEHKNY